MPFAVLSDNIFLNRCKTIKLIIKSLYFLITTGIQDTVSTLDVQILSLQVQHSLCITRCCVLSSKDDKPTVVDVVFDAETSRQLVPRVGSAVRIHPPW